MATNAVPVNADQKEEEGVKAVEANVPGVGPVMTYFKVSTVDDVDGKTTEGIETLRLSVPVQVDEEVPSIGEDGEEEKDAEGNVKMVTETYFKNVYYELDMGKASRDKLEKALLPFLKNAREVAAPATRTGYQAQTLPSGVDTTAVRKWAQAEDIKIDGKPVNEKGRVPASFIEAYEKAHKKD
ncbi:Lsr2 family protein [Streptomyces phaeochromogenes]|uniref:Lsr2 family DNA-binding protein n=1 Tax=Streptomyces phaeochromogenes TaxID=1923 RepID=UPI002E29045D|nr:histone-like nucleoid-structuring protein Lsr2 [Streptomyces phaeochromogenes]